MRDLSTGSCVWPFFSLPPSVTLDVGRERNGKLEVSQNLSRTALFRLEFYIKKDYYSWFADGTCLAKRFLASQGHKERIRPCLIGKPLFLIVYSPVPICTSENNRYLFCSG